MAFVEYFDSNKHRRNFHLAHVCVSECGSVCVGAAFLWLHKN